MKKLLHIFLSFLIVYFTTYSSYANTSVGGWSLVDSLMSGATATINATKTSGGIALESAAKIAPSVFKTGAKLIKGGGTAALLIAVPQILGDGVDWVLDPANNAVRYTDNVPDPSIWGDWVVGGSSPEIRGSSGNAVGMFQEYLDSKPSYNQGKATGPLTCTFNGSSYYCILPAVLSGNIFYDPLDDIPVPFDAYLPIEQVAAQVISNASAGHAPSQDVVKAVALEGFADGELDSALNAAANAVGAESAAAEAADTTNPPATSDPANPPFDDSAILSALYSIKAVAVGILGTTNDFFDWGKEQWSEFMLTFSALNDWVFAEDSPTDTDNTIDPVVPPVVPVQVAIDFTGGCPAPLTFDFNFYGQNYKPAIPFTPICEVAILINPIVKICATIAAAYIVAGIRQGSQ